MSRATGRHNSFIVRIWWEENEATPPLWRGSVQHAATGESCYVNSMVGILSFIQSYTGPLEELSISKSSEQD
jgi:hypothetical protein